MKAFHGALASAVQSLSSRCVADYSLRSANAVGLQLLQLLLAIAAFASPGFTQTAAVNPYASLDSLQAVPARALPPQAVRARHFLAARGWKPGQAFPRRSVASPIGLQRGIGPVDRHSVQSTQTGLTASWQPIGPTAVSTRDFGLVTGRVTALAFDPADATGNRLYVGTTGGGVWLSQNAGTSNLSYLAFIPLTDTLSALSGVVDPSISIGALTVQPGSTGVVLAGTGDPNDALDSYYGAGILRSTDGGNSWTLIQMTADQSWGFVGEGFAGFAWSTTSPQTVVAAVSSALEGVTVNAPVGGLSSAGLYYSTDSGANWNLATIQDLNGKELQGPDLPVVGGDGHAATSVIWNPVRHLFLAAVRNHGYYQSADGINWTRLGTQPGLNLDTQICLTNSGILGSLTCPVFRGALAVNPVSGDTFAWTVDSNNQDQGLWQDSCAAIAGVCANQALTFATQWSTTPLQSDTVQGAATIADGSYNLALVAIPADQDTLLLAGANDVWKCSLTSHCVWRNTTNATTCKSAAVGEYQHALAWSPANPVEVFLGNDSGLWRSNDDLGETGAACDAGDAAHFQNLNGSLGSLAEVESLAQSQSSPYVLMAGLGVNGTTGVKGTTAPAGNWPQIFGEEGCTVAIDPRNDQNWYVNSAAGVSIHACKGVAACTPDSFASGSILTDADVAGDAQKMTSPAMFLVDPLDDTQLLVGTCRVWRGPATGGWLVANKVSPILDGGFSGVACDGNALIHTMAAIALANGQEVVYVGMSGTADGGAKLAGHVLSATIDPTSSSLPAWTDLTQHTVTNDAKTFNYYGMEISSIFIDPHDASGQTLYVTVAGQIQTDEVVRTVYRSTNGGATWTVIVANLPQAPANSLVVDPQDANTVYVATDRGVYSTRSILTCADAPSTCWTAFGTGLPEAPVVALTATPVSATAQLLTAGTYGRGIWQIPLWTASAQSTLAAVTVAPTALTFSSQVSGTSSTAQTITLSNTSSTALVVSSITMSGNFSETDNCINSAVNPGATCAIQVTFTPTVAGTATGQAVVAANIAGGSVSVALHGTGLAPQPVNLSPATIAFGSVEVGTISLPLQATATNSNSFPIALISVTVSGPFVLASNACGTSSLAASAACQLTLQFQPTAAGAASGTLTFVDSSGVQSVSLTGVGAAPPTDDLSPASLAFPDTIIGQLASPLTVTISNHGDVLLTSIKATVSGAFQISNDCGTQLAGQSSCAISAVFAPLIAGRQTGILTISDLLRTQTVPLSGVGLLPPVFTVSPASLTFAAQPVNTTSAAQALTVSNTGGAPMANVGFQIIGGSAASFATGTTTCGTTRGTMLPAGSSCTVQVTFSPVDSGGNSATLVISSSTIGVTAAQVPLIGNGTATSGLSVSPAQLSFSATNISQTSAVQFVTISNADNRTDTGLSLAAVAPFAVAQSTCGSSLAAAATCTAGLVFTPIIGGEVTGTFHVTSSSASTQASAALSGVGALPASLQAVPAVLNFAPTGGGNSSASATVTVTNPGTLSSLTGLSFTASPGFQLIGTTCPATLAAQANCTLSVAFTPSGPGAQSGAISATSDSVKSPTLIALSGTGVDFTLLPLGASSQTVSSGQVANYNLTISPLGGVQADYVLRCGTLPSNTLCSFSPASETISGGATGTVAVKLSTGQSVSAVLNPQRAPTAPGVVRFLPMVCGLLPFLWFWGSKAGRKGRSFFLLVALFAIIVGGVAGCVSSGGGAGASRNGALSAGSSPTPAGTYSIPVTVSSNGVSHQLTLTLIVD